MRSILPGARCHAVLVFCLALLSPHAFADAAKTATLNPGTLANLDSRFQAFSSRFYPKLVRSDNLPKASSFDSLVQTVDDYRRQDQPVSAVAAVVNNIALVEKNADTTPIINICGLLFEANEWDTGSRLYGKVKEQGDKSLVSSVSLSLAKYHFDRNRWNETIGIVETLRSDLAPEDYHHALLMHGISLQQQRKHRAALAPYAKIPPSSRYYTAARLNMAVVNIRQDWWTDAHILINDLLADTRRSPDSELTDRLYTVLGYSLLHQQYYRDSREAFRSVSVDGKYANRALLGIALTAAHQEDYVGALNAVRVLKGSPYRDLPADEATLLIPYFHERLRQLTTASAGYTEAITYYQGRILRTQAAVPDNPEAIGRQVTATDSGTVTLNDEVIDLGEKLPKFFFSNVRMLARFQPHVHRIGDAALTREYEALNQEHARFLQATARQLLEEKSEHLRHYMNQSRYGLARMQDPDAVSPK